MSINKEQQRGYKPRFFILTENTYKSPFFADNNYATIFANKGDLYMKATGIVRRIDDLGRVVIPKEIRRTMRIREGDPLEIYTDREGEVIFKKYSPIGELTAFATEYAETLFKTCSLPIAVCDKDCIIACAGISKKEFMERKHSPEIENIIENRSLYTAPSIPEKRIFLTEENKNYKSNEANREVGKNIENLT